MATPARVASRVAGPGTVPASGDPGLSSLSSLTRQGGVYLGLRYGLGVLISLGNMFVLTWWIGPHAYGLFVTAIGLTAFLACLARSGVDTYLVRRPVAPEEKHYDIACTIILVFALVLLALGAAAVPLLTRWYGSREFAPAYLALLLTIPLVGLAGPPTAKLERALNYRAVAQIELGGQSLALLVGLTLAWRGMGVWAPVMGHLAWQSFGTVAAFRAARMVPRPRFDAGCARQMLAFGAGYTASQRAWQIRNLVNPLLVARFAGAEGAAFVGLAIRVAEGLGFIRTAAGRLAIAALARLQADKRKFGSALEQALKLQVMVLGPLLCGFALVGPFAVPRLMGMRWSPSLTVYPFVAAAVLVNSVFNLQASALFVMGKQWEVLKAYATNVALLAGVTFLLLPRLGIAAYGWAELAACLGYVFLHASLKRVVPVSQARLLGWVAAFLVPLFMVRHARWGLALAVAVVGAAAAGIVMARWRGGVWSTDRLRETFQRRARHLATFVAKARQRRFQYIAAVFWYQVNRRLYRWRAPLRRERGSVPAGPTATESEAHTHSTVVPIDLVRTRFFFNAHGIDQIVRSVPNALKQQVIAEAEQVAKHGFCFRGRECVFGAHVPWHERAEGNLSWHWDLNRHRYFVTLGTAYYYSGEGQFLEELQRLWLDWIAENPAGRGPTWQYPFEVASRLQNWVWAYFLLERSGRAEQDRLAPLLTAMREHARFLYSHLEYHWPNNHLLLEATALYEFALLFPHLPESCGQLKRAGRVLEREGLAQILPDGAHSELCSMYHRIVAGELGALLLLSRRVGKPLSAELTQRILASIAFSRALGREDGSAPLTGDSAQNDTNLRFHFTDAGASDLDYWIGWKNAPDFQPRDQRDMPVLQIFPDAGYAFLSGGSNGSSTHLTFDFGEFSRCASPNHGHCDALSFELQANGRSLIVDPGVFLPWDGDGGWARHFRSTAAHNTLVIDGREQSELSEYCDVSRTARTLLLGHRADASGLSAIAECRPYESGPGGIVHQRAICWDRDNSICVRDEVTGAGRHRLDWYFHFAHDLDAQEDGGVVLRGTSGGEELLRIRPLGTQPLSLRLIRGQPEPRTGWVSLNSAQALPAFVANYTAEVELPFAITFQIDVRASRALLTPKFAGTTQANAGSAAGVLAGAGK